MTDHPDDNAAYCAQFRDNDPEPTRREVAKWMRTREPDGEPDFDNTDERSEYQ